MAITFQQPWWLLAALVLLVAYIVYRRSAQNNDWQRVIKQPLLQFLTLSLSVNKQRSLALALAVLATLALANPSIPNQDPDTYRHAESWFLLADVSRSMTLDDVRPSRISALRDAAMQIAQNSQSKPVALIIFSGDAFLLSPPAYLSYRL